MSHLWTTLEDGMAADPSHPRLEQRMPGAGGLGVVLGLTQMGRRPYFVAEIGYKVPPTLGDLARFGNIDSKVEVGRDGRYHVSVTLADRRFIEVFDLFTRYVHQHMEGKTDTDERFSILRKAFRDWETMLRSGQTPVLGEEEQRGLIAEIWFLVRQIVPRCSAAEALKSWRGPHGDSHDFQFGRVHIEVKSSSPASPSLVRISSAQQLDDVGLDSLFLAVVAVEADEDGQSLPMAVAEARAALQGQGWALESFNQAVQRAGYLDAQRDRYSRRYREGVWSYYSVDDTFPRIVRPPNGVLTLRYDLDLVAARGHLVQDAQVWKTLGWAK